MGKAVAEEGAAVVRGEEEEEEAEEEEEEEEEEEDVSIPPLETTMVFVLHVSQIFLGPQDEW